MVNKPIKTFRAKNVQISVWKNKNVNKSGVEFETTSLTLQRSYKPEGKDWVSQEIIIPNVKELNKIKVVLEQASNFLAGLIET